MALRSGRTGRVFAGRTEGRYSRSRSGPSLSFRTRALIALLLTTGLLWLPGLAAPATAGAASEVDDAASWLNGRVLKNGGFPGTNGKADWLATSRAVMALGLAGLRIDEIKRADGYQNAFEWLTGHKNRAGTIEEMAVAILAARAVGKAPGWVVPPGKLRDALAKSPTAGNRVRDAALGVLAQRKLGASTEADWKPTAKWICKVRNGDGGWGRSGSSDSDAESTGMALTVVGGGSVDDAAIKYLAGQQAENGGFPDPSGKTNSITTAAVIQGLLGAGRAADSLARKGTNGLKYLRKVQLPGGAIPFSGAKQVRKLAATSLALPSLAQERYGRVARSDCAKLLEKPKPKDPPASGGGTGGGSTGGTGGGGNQGGGSSGGIGGYGSSGSGSGSNRGNSHGNSGGSTLNPAPNPDPPFDDSGAPATPTIPAVTPVVPSAELVAASAAASPPSALAAALICLFVAGGLIGGTVLLARKQGW